MMEKLVMIKEQLALSEPGRIEGNGGGIVGNYPHRIVGNLACLIPSVRSAECPRDEIGTGVPWELDKLNSLQFIGGDVLRAGQIIGKLNL